MYRDKLRRAPAAVAVLILAASLVAPHVFAATADPAVNIPPVPNFNGACSEQAGVVTSGYCQFNPLGGQWVVNTPAREAAALQAISHARLTEGLPGLRLPAGWSRLSSNRQQFVLVNLERVARGLPPLVGLAPALDALAMTGARNQADPVVPAPLNRYASGTNWAGDQQPAVAMYGYMYLDGWGGSPAQTPNLDCSGPGAPGCWGHRNNVLGAYGESGLMGAAAITGGPSGTGSSAQVFLAYNGPPLALSYTWAQALAAGAGGGLPTDPTAPPPLWPFADMAATTWAAGPAAALAAVGVVRGVAPGAFGPQAPVTLEQLVVLLARVLGWPPANGAAPAGTAAWAAAAMAGAAARHLLPSGVAPAAPLNRLDAARLVTGALRLPPANVPLPFTDLGGLSPGALATLRTAVADGLLRGAGGGRLLPGAGLDRAQAVVLLLRALLWRARNGQSSVAGHPLAVTPLPGGAELYRLGSIRMLAPSASADPVAFWYRRANGARSALVGLNGRWWNAVGTGNSLPAPTWAAGASGYAHDVLQLWPAGSQGDGPALFAPLVRVLHFPNGVQVLAPGGTAWQQVPPAAASGVVRTSMLALLG